MGMLCINVMNKLFSVLVFLAVSPIVKPQTQPPLDSPNRKGDIFNLEIIMSFHEKTSFKFSRGSNGANVFLAKDQIEYDENGKKSADKIHDQVIKLSKAQEEQISSLLRTSLKKFNLDDAGGLDGSTWCLSLEGYATEISMCFWSPGYKSKERGLEALNELGQYMAELHGVKVY